MQLTTPNNRLMSEMTKCYSFLQLLYKSEIMHREKKTKGSLKSYLLKEDFTIERTLFITISKNICNFADLVLNPSHYADTVLTLP